jgi:hypothetical protein
MHSTRQNTPACCSGGAWGPFPGPWRPRLAGGPRPGVPVARRTQTPCAPAFGGCRPYGKWRGDRQWRNVPAWQQEFNKRFAILDDKSFHHLARFGTEVNAHVKIDQSKGTVETGGLWYQESLPAETVLVAPPGAAWDVPIIPIIISAQRWARRVEADFIPGCRSQSRCRYRRLPVRLALPRRAISGNSIGSPRAGRPSLPSYC